MATAILIWEALLRDEREVATSADIAAVARRIEADPRDVIRSLRRSGRLVPLFKGFYYVRGPEELALTSTRHNHLELFAMAARAKGIGNWYFGLDSALRLNRMTHEDRRWEDVISDSLYRPAGVAVGGKRFVVSKWSPRLVRFGVVRLGPLPYSDPEKTVLDLAYLDHLRTLRGRGASGAWREHAEHVSARKLARYAKAYPLAVRREVLA